MQKAKKPLISVITASYNYEQYIKETIDSVINQDYKNWELIIVDDGSKDNSVNVIQRYCEKYPNIKLYQHNNSENKGLPETIKLGIEKSQGEYIAFLESDDFWTNNYLSEKINALNKFPEAKLIFNDLELFGDKNQTELLTPFMSKCRNLSKEAITPADISKYYINFPLIPTLSCLLVEKDILKNCDFECSLPQYIDWWIEAQITFLEKAIYVDKKLTNWRIHAQSYIERTKNGVSIQERESFSKEILKMLKQIDTNKYKILLANAAKYKRQTEDKHLSKEQKEKIIRSTQNQKTYLYGAGLYTQELLQKQDLSSLNILGIIDGDKNKQGSKIGPYEIFHKNQIKEIQPDIILISLAEPSLIFADLKKFLEENKQETMLVSNFFQD